MKAKVSSGNGLSPNHYLNKYCIFVLWILSNNLLYHFNRNSNIVHELYFMPIAAVDIVYDVNWFRISGVGSITDDLLKLFGKCHQNHVIVNSWISPNHWQSNGVALSPWIPQTLTVGFVHQNIMNCKSILLNRRAVIVLVPWFIMDMLV